MFSSLDDDETRIPRIDPADEEEVIRRDLAPARRSDPVIEIELPHERQTGLGTGFALNGTGAFVTAQHVVTGCSKVGVMRDRDRYVTQVNSVSVHRKSDTAVVASSLKAQPLLISTDKLEVGEPGYHFGFPGGQPQQLRSRLIGRKVMRTTGRLRYSEPVLAWAEKRRLPDFGGSLQGISGGVALDETGRIVGINVAGSRRRGRLFTTVLDSLHYLLDRADIAPAAESRLKITPEDLEDPNLPKLGAKLRKKGVVVKVICVVDLVK